MMVMILMVMTRGCHVLAWHVRHAISAVATVGRTSAWGGWYKKSRNSQKENTHTDNTRGKNSQAALPNTTPRMNSQNEHTDGTHRKKRTDSTPRNNSQATLPNTTPRMNYQNEPTERTLRKQSHRQHAQKELTDSTPKNHSQNELPE